MTPPKGAHGMPHGMRPGGFPMGRPGQAPSAEADLFAEDIDFTQIEQESSNMLQTNYLTQENASFSETEGHFLTLEYNGTKYERVQVIRTFPYSNPDSFLSIRESDDKSTEIGIIRNFSEDLPEETGTILSRQLAIRYFTPVIENIIQIKEKSGFVFFDVVTNYGECQFCFRSNVSSIVRLDETRMIICDLDNNRFEIPDTKKLSSRELKKLDLYL